MLGQLRCLGLFWLMIGLVSPRLSAAEPLPLGTRRELFVDDRLIERLAGQATLRLHHSNPRDVSCQAGSPDGIDWWLWQSEPALPGAGD